MTTVTIRAALADAGLLGNALVGDSWATWRVFLIAAMGERLNAKERAIFRRFTGRAREPGARIEEALFLIGRRGGKDRASAVLASHLAALVDWSGVLAKGERGLVLCIGADTKQAAVQRDYIEGVLDGSPLLRGLVVNRNADAIELSNGISIEVRAASFRRLRGVTTVGVIASEAAFWLDDTSANADVEILNAIRPTLATTGGPLIIITTPYAQRGVVWDMHRQHYGAKGDPLILVVQGETRDFNETLPQKVVDRAMERDPASAAAEYLAKFRTDVAAFVARAAVEACVVSGVRERAPVGGVTYSAFVDPSGGSASAMAVAVAHREEGGPVLDAVREVRPPFSPETVVGEFAELVKAYGISHVVGDRFGGTFPIEQFAKSGVRYEASDSTKSDLYGDLLPLLNSGGVELLDHPRLIGQFCGLERRAARSGKDSIGPAPGALDDAANAAAGALLLAQRGAPALWRREDLPIVPTVVLCEVVFAVLMAGEREVGVGYFARDRDKNLHVVSAESVPMTAALLDGVADRLLELAKATHATSGAYLFCQAALVGEFARRGHAAHDVDAILAEGAPALALSAAAHIAQGRLKISDARHAGILTGWGDNPLRLSMLVAVAVGLDEGRTLRGRAA